MFIDLSFFLYFFFYYQFVSHSHIRHENPFLAKINPIKNKLFTKQVNLQKLIHGRAFETHGQKKQNHAIFIHKRYHYKLKG